MTQMDVFILVVDILNRLEIPYMLTGAYAVSFYGKIRNTHDIDLMISISRPAAEKIHNAFKASFYVDEEMIKEAINRVRMFNIIHNETQTKIDFWLVGDDEFGREEFGRRKKALISNTAVFVPTPEDLIITKLSWYKKSRLQKHLEDARGICEVQSGSLDLVYINKWAARFSLKNLLKEIFT